MPEERWQKILDGLPQLKELTRVEPGCIKFDFDPCDNVKFRLNVSEIFENRTMFEAHGEHMKCAVRAKMTDGIARHYQIIERD